MIFESDIIAIADKVGGLYALNFVKRLAMSVDSKGLSTRKHLRKHRRSKIHNEENISNEEETDNEMIKHSISVGQDDDASEAIFYECDSTMEAVDVDEEYWKWHTLVTIVNALT